MAEACALCGRDVPEWGAFLLHYTSIEDGEPWDVEVCGSECLVGWAIGWHNLAVNTGWATEVPKDEIEEAVEAASVGWFDKRDSRLTPVG